MTSIPQWIFSAMGVKWNLACALLLIKVVYSTARKWQGSSVKVEFNCNGCGDTSLFHVNQKWKDLPGAHSAFVC